MVVFAAAIGLRPGEWIALEQRDLDRRSRVVYVRRAFGRLKRPKTRRSVRAVPLRATALDALDRLSTRADTPLLFPTPRGGYLDLYNSAAASGSRPRTPLGSSRCDGRTTCATRSRPSR